MTIGKRVRIWLIALLVGVGLASATYWIVWFGFGSLVCGDGCEEAPLAVGMLGAVAALIALLVGRVLFVRGAHRWFGGA